MNRSKEDLLAEIRYERNDIKRLINVTGMRAAKERLFICGMETLLEECTYTDEQLDEILGRISESQDRIEKLENIKRQYREQVERLDEMEQRLIKL